MMSAPSLRPWHWNGCSIQGRLIALLPLVDRNDGLSWAAAFPAVIAAPCTFRVRSKVRLRVRDDLSRIRVRLGSPEGGATVAWVARRSRLPLIFPARIRALFAVPPPARRCCRTIDSRLSLARAGLLHGCRAAADERSGPCDAVTQRLMHSVERGVTRPERRPTHFLCCLIAHCLACSKWLRWRKRADSLALRSEPRQRYVRRLIALGVCHRDAGPGDRRVRNSPWSYYLYIRTAAAGT